MALAKMYASDEVAIRALGRMPFLERRELASVASLVERTALNSLHRLEEQGLVAFVKHSLTERSRMQRWYLTPAGIESLADFEDGTIEEVLRRFPLSAEWQRSLLRRMEAVATCYRIARDAAGPYEGCMWWRWERSGPLDAVMTLPDGCSLGIARFGSALPRRGMFSRLGSLLEMYRRNLLFGVLVVAPGPIEVHSILEWMRGRSFNMSVSVEKDIRSGLPGDDLWRSHIYRPDTAFPLKGMIESTVKRSVPPAQPAPRRVSMPDDELLVAGGLDSLSCKLTEPAASMLDVLADWPLMRQSDMSNLLSISPERIRAGVAQMRGLELVVGLRISKTAAQRRENETRLALSLNGLRYLSRRDRTRLSDLSRFWAVHETQPKKSDFHFGGSKLRVLARELKHTDGVYHAVSVLAASCRRSMDWELVEALPAHRWERWFLYNNRRYGIRPDAVGQLTWRGNGLSLLLEYEERAIKPARMRERLLRYRFYYGALETQRDFDCRSILAVVFPDKAAASRFAAFASSEMKRAARSQKEIPLLVGSLVTLDAEGFLGCCWLLPSNLSLGTVKLESLLPGMQGS